MRSNVGIVKKLPFFLSSWRTIYILFSVVLRFAVCMHTSYIHPDEFYQSFQAIYNDNVPWEFSDTQNPCRSSVPLLVLYYPVILLGTYFHLSSFSILLLVKFEFCLFTWIVGEWCLYRIMPIKQERIKALFFFNTSYVTLVYQSHTFSNSIETCVVLLVVYLIDDIRQYIEVELHEVSSKAFEHGSEPIRKEYSAFRLILLGLLVSFGIFNRITFLCWLILPSIYLFKFFLRYKMRSLIPIASFLIFSLLFILIDTRYFHGHIDFPDNLIVAPLNSLLYNSKVDNLSKHGIHPLYTHVLINYPQIVGPLLLLLFPFRRSEYLGTTPFLAYVSGLFSLSIIPHQELRFLIPIIPLACCCVNFNGSPKFVRTVIKLWLFFNVLMIIFMGFLHQAGLVGATTYLSEILNSEKSVKPFSLIYWRTYKPPTWLLKSYSGANNNTESSMIFFNRDENDLLNADYSSIEGDYVVDFMGLETDSFIEIVSRIVNTNPNGRRLYLVVPDNAMLNLEENDEVQFNFIELWSTNWHIDLDHFEPDKFGIRTFTPGITVYKVMQY